MLAQVTLLIPWLAKSDQARIFPNNLTFDTPEEQETYVREWAKKRTGFDSEFKVTFYPGRYAIDKCSILPVGDPTSYIPDHEVRCTAVNLPLRQHELICALLRAVYSIATPLLMITMWPC